MLASDKCDACNEAPPGRLTRASAGTPLRYLSVSNPCASGVKAITPAPSPSVMSSKSFSTQRLSRLYAGWCISNGTFHSLSNAAISRVFTPEYEEMPMYNALPCCTAVANALAVSSSGVSGSKRCE
ncbi:hypothetical protein D3C80_1776760 [compost metagenome]